MTICLLKLNQAVSATEHWKSCEIAKSLDSDLVGYSSPIRANSKSQENKWTINAIHMRRLVAHININWRTSAIRRVPAAFRHLRTATNQRAFLAKRFQS